MANARQSYTELGETLDLTAQAVHRRVQTLIEQGIIGGSGTFLSTKALGQMWVVTFGMSKAPSMAELDKKLKKEPLVAVFFVASGNFVYIHGMVRDPNEMARFVSFVQKEAMISDIQVGIVPTPPADPEATLSNLDLKIVKALENDSRRPLSDVADELGTTVKTVRRRLERLEKEGLVIHTIHWLLGRAGGTITNLHLHLREDVERDKVAFSLIKKISSNVIRTYAFGNMPNVIVATLWTPTGQEVQDLCQDLENEGLYITVVPNMMRQVYYYDEHRAGYLEEIINKRAVKERTGH